MKRLIIALIFFSFRIGINAQIFTQAKAEKALQTYRDNLTILRKEHSVIRTLPNITFFFFGMGDRLKMMYKSGSLINAKTGKVLRRWKVKTAIIVPSEYLVHMELESGKAVDIQEDTQGVYIYENGMQLIMGESRMSLPTFSDKKFGPVLRVLHHEVLINVDEGLPVPNFMVYQKPRYRDAAIMTMVLKKTDNLNLIVNWITNLKEPCDKNAEGSPEIDNLGQVLYIISTVSDRKHPLIEKVLEMADSYKNANYIEGKTDYTFHPVYQTKWLKFGLKSLGISDEHKIPLVYDNYSTLVWWDYRTESVGGRQFDETISTKYPYLTWAEDHFSSQKRGMTSLSDYPLSWESESKDANYEGMNVIDPIYAQTKLCVTHGWHASEMFLMLLDAK